MNVVLSITNSCADLLLVGRGRTSTLSFSLKFVIGIQIHEQCMATRYNLPVQCSAGFGQWCGTPMDRFMT